MKLSLLSQPSAPLSVCPFRLVDEQGAELAWANAFLDAQRIRQLSRCSLRAYAYDLLHLARWLDQTQQALAQLDQSLLLDYVRFQLDHQPPPTATTINHRLGVLRCLYRFHYGREIPAGKSYFRRTLDAITSRLRSAATPGSPAVCDCGSPNTWSSPSRPTKSTSSGEVFAPFAIWPSWL